jgi:hypothetical protein
MSFPLCKSFKIIRVIAYFTHIFHFEPTFSVYSSKYWNEAELEFAAFVTTAMKTLNSENKGYTD